MFFQQILKFTCKMVQCDPQKFGSELPRVSSLIVSGLYSHTVLLHSKELSDTVALLTALINSGC